MDFSDLFHAREAALFHLADAAGNVAESADRILKTIAHHRRGPVVAQLLKKRVHGLKGVHAIVIVRIEYGKGAVDIRLRAEHRMHRPVGLGASLRYGIPIRQRTVVLKGVAHFDAIRKTVSAELSDRLQVFRTDHEYHTVEARADRVVHGVFHQDLPVGTHARGLLTSSVAGGNPRRHYHQCRVHALYAPVPPAPVLPKPPVRRPSAQSSRVMPKGRNTPCAKASPSAMRNTLSPALVSLMNMCPSLSALK